MFSVLRLFSAVLLLTISGCAPPGVPPDASRHWSFKDGPYWTWKRTARSGCVSWIAEKDWASVNLLVDTPCKSIPEIGNSGGKGLTYFSADDFLVFENYFPWSAEIYDKLIVYDGRGMVVKTLPCPNQLAPPQIAELKATALAVSGNNLTNPERQVLSRIVERLSRVDGRSLASGQDGCSDWHDGEDDHRKVDLWSGK